jgi:hypothetical protein
MCRSSWGASSRRTPGRNIKPPAGAISPGPRPAFPGRRIGYPEKVTSAGIPGFNEPSELLIVRSIA